MKVMILANNDAGLYKFRKELLEELLKDHEVIICLPDGEYVKDMTDMGCRFLACNLLDRRGMNPVKELKLIQFYQRLLKEQKPDIVFTYTRQYLYDQAQCVRRYGLRPFENSLCG